MFTYLWKLWGDYQNNYSKEERFTQLAKAGALIAGAAVLLIGACLYAPTVITVSNSVSGRELPIYCVQTDRKVVGLSFDAA